MIIRLKSLVLSHPFFVLSLIYFLFRLPHLTLLPIFSDEANYLDWGYRAVFKGIPFHSLYDAKQPFLMWFFGLFQVLSPDPLWGARLVSVLTGYLNLFLIFRLSLRFFHLRPAIFASLLYIFIPVFFFYDRQALMESSLISISLSSFLLLLQLGQTPRRLTAFLLGIVLGIGFFIKNTALIFLLTSLVFIFALTLRRRQPFMYLQLFLFLFFGFLITVLPLLLQPQFWSTAATNDRYAFTFFELLHFPFLQWIYNLVGNLYIAFIELTPPVFLAALIGLFSFRRHPLARSFFLWFLLPLVIYLLVSRQVSYINIRYLTPFLPLLLLPAADLLSRKLFLFIAALLLCLVPISLLLFSPPSYFSLKSRLTPYHYSPDYVTGFDTGYQVAALLDYLRPLSQSQPIYIATAIHAFNPEAALLTYFRRNPQAVPVYLDGLMFTPEIKSIDCLSADRPVYFVAKLNDTAGLERFLDPVTVITNPYNSDYSTIYRLKPDCTGNSLILKL